ncbi:MAG: helix-turn-helix domain-containing protein [Actinomycetota bacterium]
MEDTLNLKQVAHRLGVHYMTAYRYVRQGRLAATREGTGWRVRAEDVARLAAGPGAAGGAAARPGVDWAARLTHHLLRGDETGAWSVVDRALAAGATPQACYLDVVAPALAGIGAGGEHGELGLADQYVATATAVRVVARLGARFRRPGRSRGTVVLGAPRGERHSLPIAIGADLVRLGGYTVLELGADVPAEVFVTAARRVDRLVAVGIGVTLVESLAAAMETVAAVRAGLPAVPVLLGGQAVDGPGMAARAGATGWARDGSDLLGAVDAAVAGVAHLGVATSRARRGTPSTPSRRGAAGDRPASGEGRS